MPATDSKLRAKLYITFWNKPQTLAAQPSTDALPETILAGANNF
jgi:hypothetical protein